MRCRVLLNFDTRWSCWPWVELPWNNSWMVIGNSSIGFGPRKWLALKSIMISLLIRVTVFAFDYPIALNVDITPTEWERSVGNDETVRHQLGKPIVISRLTLRLVDKAGKLTLYSQAPSTAQQLYYSWRSCWRLSRLHSHSVFCWKEFCCEGRSDRLAWNCLQLPLAMAKSRRHSVGAVITPSKSNSTRLLCTLQEDKEFHHSHTCSDYSTLSSASGSAVCISPLLSPCSTDSVSKLAR